MRWKSLLLHPYPLPLPLLSSSSSLITSFSSLPFPPPTQEPNTHSHSSPPSPHPSLHTFQPHQTNTQTPTTPPHQSYPSTAMCRARACEKSCFFDNALWVLGGITQPSLVSWNLMISRYNRLSRFDESTAAFLGLISFGFKPDQFTYASVISACTATRNVRFGEQLCSLVLKNGFLSNVYVLAGLIDLFSKSGNFDSALRVFSETVTGNVVCWNTIIIGGVRNGENSISWDLFRGMVGGFCVPNAFTFSSVLTACAALGELEMGRGIHAWVVKCNAEDDLFVGTTIVDLYAKCGDMAAAVKEFSLMPVRNVVSWTAIISGFVQKNDAVSALHFFKEMLSAKLDINTYTVTSVLAACTKSVMEKVAIQVHCWIMKTRFSLDLVVKNALISMYAKIGSIQMFEKVFGEASIMESPSTWSAMISGLAQCHSLKRSIELFQRMFHKDLKPDKFCCSSVLSIVECVELGRQIHSYVAKAGLVLDALVGCALFTMYSKCGSIVDSYRLFSEMPERDGVAWSSMISGLAEHGCANESFRLFRQMIYKDSRPDNVTLSALLTACDAQQFLRKGKEIHGHAFRVGLGHDSLIGGSLVTMYSKCKCLAFARRVFDGVPLKDEVIWSSLVSGYATNGYSEEAIREFHRMVLAGFEIDDFTCSSVLGMCGALLRPVLGRQLHAHTTKAGLNYYLPVSSALVTMYSKCGRIDDSREVFDKIGSPDLITWTAMINGYAQHGRGLEALKLFEMMKEHGVKPDSMTLVGVLSACSHNGLVEEGFLFFNSMSRDYGLEPGVRHYACMVDLLGRSGRLKEAVEFIDRMPMKANSLVWSTLLAACRVHGDAELGKFAAKKVFEMEPCDSCPYIFLSNISADMGDWEEAVRIRGLMDRVGIHKEPGWSIV